jgi:hypothetical protein
MRRSSKDGLTVVWFANASRTADEYWVTGTPLLMKLDGLSAVIHHTMESTTNRRPLGKPREAKLCIKSEKDLLDTAPWIAGIAKKSSNIPAGGLGAS